MAEPHAPEHFADWNEQMLQRYDPEVFEHHPRGIVRWVENKRARAVIRWLQARPGHRVLDVGCGTGHLLAQLPGRERHGVDLSPRMVQRAQAILGSGAQIIQGDAEHLPYADGYFDRVIASSLFSHVLRPEQVIAEITRVTKAGGRIVISVCDEDQIERGMNWVKSLRLQGLFFGTGQDGQPRVYNVEYHLHRFSLPRLREMVGESLSELRVVRVPFVFPVHVVAAYEKG
ncbi:MAG: methyltransferase domain-containing protein [Planctomycetota bacterium]